MRAVVAWAGGFIVAVLALNGARLLLHDLRGYWPQFMEQIDLARFEMEHGDSPFIKP